MNSARRFEDLLRDLAPRVLGALLRRYGQFDLAEEAVQEALLAASVQWPTEGLPDNPRAWLITVASRRLADQVRSDAARRRREESVAALDAVTDTGVPGADHDRIDDRDDTLTLLGLCCHPALSRPSQVALTLRAVGGLTTGEIARAFLIPEATMAQRISRAKQRIKSSGTEFRSSDGPEPAARMTAVLQVLYLIFNEGYTSSSGPELARNDLTWEAIRLTRIVRRLLPDDGEVAGLLALMLLTEARRPARTSPDGALIPLAEQDRRRWNTDDITEGVDLISGTLAAGALGPYQLQAAIAAVHDEAQTAGDTDWDQIVALYELLERRAPSPVVRLNHAVALGMARGPQAGLRMLETVSAKGISDGGLDGHHRLDAVRAHLLELAGELPAARTHYLRAARATNSLPEQRYLQLRAARLSDNIAGQ